MSQDRVEQGFELLQKSVSLIKTALECSFFDGYIETGENILEGNQVRVIEGVPSKEIEEQLTGLYTQFSELDLSSEDMRKVTQLVLLDGTMKEPIQANHQLTPDALGYLFGYLAEQLLQTKKTHPVAIHDLTVGTGNLLLTVMLHLQQAGFKVQASGVEVDDTLLSVASISSNLIGEKIEFFHQDSLQNLLVEPADLTLADLPVGYYPDDAHAKKFVVGADGEHTYAHHLLMEQAMTYTKKDGYGVFLVPEDFLVSAQSDNLKKWLGESVYLQAVLGLPETLFQSASSRKSIIIVQKRSEQTQQAKEVLLAKIPSLKEPKAIQRFFKEFSDWQENNI